jgi:hypothetical protein
VFKGALIASLRPPFDLLGPHRLAIVAVFVTVGLLWVWRFAQGGIMATLPLSQVLLVGGFAAITRAAVLLSSVRVFEHGIERDIPRSMNKSVYLSWERIDHYQIDGHALRYRWRRGALTVLRDGRYPARWPHWYFPRALTLPDARMADKVRVLLSSRPQAQQ